MSEWPAATVTGLVEVLVISVSVSPYGKEPSKGLSGPAKQAKIAWLGALTCTDEPTRPAAGVAATAGGLSGGCRGPFWGLSGLSRGAADEPCSRLESPALPGNPQAHLDGTPRSYRAVASSAGGRRIPISFVPWWRRLRTRCGQMI